MKPLKCHLSLMTFSIIPQGTFSCFSQHKKSYFSLLSKISIFFCSPIDILEFFLSFFYSSLFFYCKTICFYSFVLIIVCVCVCYPPKKNPNNAKKKHQQQQGEKVRKKRPTLLGCGVLWIVR